MTYSTLTWFKGVYKPQHTKEQFVLAGDTGSKGILVFNQLYNYNEEIDAFEGNYPSHMYPKIPRSMVAYWAYVPVEVDEHLKLDAVSQVPNQ